MCYLNHELAVYRQQLPRLLEGLDGDVDLGDQVLVDEGPGVHQWRMGREFLSHLMLPRRLMRSLALEEMEVQLTSALRHTGEPGLLAAPDSWP